MYNITEQAYKTINIFLELPTYPVFKIDEHKIQKLQRLTLFPVLKFKNSEEICL